MADPALRQHELNALDKLGDMLSEENVDGAIVVTEVVVDRLDGERLGQLVKSIDHGWVFIGG